MAFKVKTSNRKIDLLHRLLELMYHALRLRNLRFVSLAVDMAMHHQIHNLPLDLQNHQSLLDLLLLLLQNQAEADYYLLRQIHLE